MAVLVSVEARGFGKCSCCGGTWRTCERFLKVLKPNKAGDKWVKADSNYCVHCERLARLNNDIPADDPIHRNEAPSLDTADDYDDEAGLRRAEEYAAYQYAGATEHFWSDADAGYVDGFPQYRGRRR